MAPSNVCALEFEFRAPICRFLWARAQSSGTPRPYKYFSPSATSRSSKLTGGVVGDGLETADFRVGAAGAASAGLGAGLSGASVASGAAVAGTGEAPGFAADSPELEFSFAIAVWSGAAAAGLGDAAPPPGDSAAGAWAVSPLPAPVAACASGGTEFPGGSTGAGEVGGRAESGAAFAGVLAVVGF